MEKVHEHCDAETASPELEPVAALINALRDLRRAVGMTAPEEDDDHERLEPDDIGKREFEIGIAVGAAVKQADEVLKRFGFGATQEEYGIYSQDHMRSDPWIEIERLRRLCVRAMNGHDEAMQLLLKTAQENRRLKALIPSSDK